MKTTLKFLLFVLLTTVLSIFETTSVMAQSNRYTRSARTHVTSPQRSVGNSSYARKNQPGAIPRSQYQSVESRARQSAQIRMQGTQNSDRIIEERARMKAEKAVQNGNHNGSNNSCKSSSSTSTRRCSYCKGVGTYECHRDYFDVNHEYKIHNCPQCGVSHDMEKSHSHKCMKCDGKGWK